MELVKKNVLSIICGVVALAAIAFHLFYTSGQFSTLRKEAEARAAKQAELQTIQKKQHSWPVVGDSPAMELGKFPDPDLIERGKLIVQQLQGQATALSKKAVTINHGAYTTLVPESLPRPSDPRKFEFREQYNLVLKPGGKPRSYDANKPILNLPDDVLKSAFPTTDQEIADAKVKKWTDEYAPKLIVVNGVPANQKEVVTEYLKAIANFDEQFRSARAMQYKVYLEPTALMLSPRLSMSASTAPTVADIWFGQMSLWIQQDVCNAIAQMNAKSANIPSSPVKHLVTLDVKQDQTMYIVKGGLAALPMAGAGMVDGGAPIDPSAGGDPSAGIPGGDAKDFSISATGRMSTPNSLYDVVHFDLIAVVDRECVRSFIEMMQFGRFITVLQADIQNIDLTEAVNDGYDYGQRPVVQLRMKCEALFLREWTVRNKGPMPDDVQRMLRIPVAPPPGPAQDPNAVAAQ